MSEACILTNLTGCEVRNNKLHGSGRTPSCVMTFTPHSVSTGLESDADDVAHLDTVFDSIFVDFGRRRWSGHFDRGNDDRLYMALNGPGAHESIMEW